MAVTLRQIAQETGLTYQTVGHVLNPRSTRRHLYSEETRQRVLQAAKQLNYQPNLVARGLKAGRSMAIGLLVGSLHPPILVAKLSQIESAAQEAGYTTFVTLGLNFPPPRTVAVIDQLLGRRIDGLVLVHAVPPEPLVMDRLAQAKIPLMFVAGMVDEAIIPWQLRFDSLPALRDAAHHVAALGHRQGVFICTPSDWHNPALKAAIWQQAGREAGLEVLCPQEYLLAPSHDYPQAVYELVRQRGLQGRLPKLLLTNNDACAIAAVAALASLGIRVPQDISVVGFDDTPDARFCLPALTTIHQPRELVGKTAFAMLLRAMHGQGQGDVQTLAYRFIPRDSTGPAPVHAPQAVVPR